MDNARIISNLFMVAFVLGVLFLALSGCSRSEYDARPVCTVYDEVTGAVIICPDGTEIQLQPDMDDIFGEHCDVFEEFDSYHIECHDDEIVIPKDPTIDDAIDDTSESDEDEKGPMRCKRNAHKKFKCGRTK